MNHAQRYEYLTGLTGGRTLDSDYRAAFYILSSVPELFEVAREYVTPDGILFDQIKKRAKGNLEEPHEHLLSIAQNLFSWTSSTAATPHIISRLTYPWMEIVCNAIFISSGQVQVQVQIQIQENEDGDPEIILDASQYERTKEIYEKLHSMGERMTVGARDGRNQMEEMER